jgi:hypothetical protein
LYQPTTPAFQQKAGRARAIAAEILDQLVTKRKPPAAADGALILDCGVRRFLFVGILFGKGGLGFEIVAFLFFFCVQGGPTSTSRTVVPPVIFAVLLGVGLVEGRKGALVVS